MSNGSWSARDKAWAIVALFWFVVCMYLFGFPWGLAAWIVGGFITLLIKAGWDQANKEEREEALLRKAQIIQAQQIVDGTPQSTSSKETIVKETIVREVVMIPCPHCQALMPNISLYCPNCGAPKKR